MCKEVSECSVRVWQGSKCSKPQCDGSGLPGRSVTVYEMLIIIQVLHMCFACRQFNSVNWTGETARECCEL